VEKKNTNLQFQFMYAISMIMVVAGHCLGGGIFFEESVLVQFATTYFVFSSGFFYKKEDEDNVLKAIIKKTKKLVVPLYIWTILYGLFVNYLCVYGFTINSQFTDGRFTLYNIILGPILTGHEFALNCPSWFVMPLYTTFIVNLLLSKLLSKVKWNVIVLEVLYLFFAIFMLWVKWDSVWCLPIQRMAIFLSVYGMARVYKEYIYGKIENTVYVYIALLVLQALLLCINGGHMAIAFVSSGIYERPYVSFIQMFIAIFFVVVLSKDVQQIMKNSRILKLISKHTYGIMMHQLLAFFCFNTLLFFLSKNNLFEGFDVNAFKSNVYYQFTFNGNRFMLMVYLLLGIFIPIIIDLVIYNINKMVKKSLYFKIIKFGG